MVSHCGHRTAAMAASGVRSVVSPFKRRPYQSFISRVLMDANYDKPNTSVKRLFGYSQYAWVVLLYVRVCWSADVDGADPRRCLVPAAAGAAAAAVAAVSRPLRRLLRYNTGRGALSTRLCTCRVSP